MKWNVFNELYPFDDSIKKSVLTALSFGLFVFLFLAIFNPFGLGNFNHPNKTLYLAGYGMVTSFCLLISGLGSKIIFPNWFCKEKWTVGKNIFYTCFMFVFIGFGNLSYSVFLGFLSFSADAFWHYQIITLLVGILPVVISNIYYYNRKLSQALKEADSLNREIHSREGNRESITLPSKNKSEDLQTDLDSLLAIKAVENYVEVYHVRENSLQKTVLRNALKAMEASLSDHGVFQKCHRSFLVNLNAVQHFSGNAQGLSLDFGKDFGIHVPVSRAYVSTIKTKLHAKTLR